MIHSSACYSPPHHSLELAISLIPEEQDKVDLGLNGKIVLVTGGSKGIGLACARAFLQEGARVAIVSRTQSNLDVALTQLASPQDDLIAVSADLTRSEPAMAMVKEVEARLGAIDILVNSAGAAKRYLPEDLNATAWHAAMDAKYFSTIHAIDAVLPGMVARGKGVVINIVGMGGKVATPIHLPGGAANSALMLATVGLANVYGPEGYPRQRHQSRRHYDRSGQGGAEAGGQNARRVGRGSAGARSGEGAAAQIRTLGRRREPDAVSRVRSGELCHGRCRAHGRWLESSPISSPHAAITTSAISSPSSKSRAS